MQPFAAVATALVPELAPLIAGDQAGTLEPTIVRTVADTTRASTAADAHRMLTANDKLAAQLQTRLKKIAAVAEKIQNDDLLLLSDDWAPAGRQPPPPPSRQPYAPPPPPAPTAETPLKMRKILLKERALHLKEAQFEHETTRRWYQSTPILVTVIASIAAICFAAVVSAPNLLQANNQEAVAIAHERASEAALAAAELAAAHAAKPAPTPSSAAVPNTAAAPPAQQAALQPPQDPLQNLLANAPQAAFTCNPATAAARLTALRAQFPAAGPKLEAFYLQDATTCGPPDRKLTTTQSFYAQAALTTPLALTTVFIQYPNPAQAATATTLAARLAQNALFYIPAPQQIDPAIAPRRAETNYYTKADAPTAAALTAAANTIPTMPPTHPNFFVETIHNPPAGTLEIWFPRTGA